MKASKVIAKTEHASSYEDVNLLSALRPMCGLVKVNQSEI